MSSHEELGRLLRENRNLVLSSPLDSLQDLGGCRLDLDHYLQHQEQFHQIPEDVAQRLMVLDPRLRTPKYFPLMIRPGMRAVFVPCYPKCGEYPIWNEEHISNILRLILQRCKPGTLEKFDLFRFEGPGLPLICHPENLLLWHDLPEDPDHDLDLIHAILRVQPNLREFRVKYDVSAETLYTLAKHCPQIRSVTFRLCKDLDMATMRLLVQRCPLLHTLHTTQHGKDEVLNHALLTLPNLVIAHSIIMTPKLRSRLNSGVPLPSKTLRLSVAFAGFASQLGELALFNKHFPKLNAVLVNAQNLHQCQFTTVKWLKILYMRPEYVGRLYALLERCGAQIQHLVFFGRRDDGTSVPVSTVDISRIFKSCPLLETLEIEDNIHFSQSCKEEVTHETVEKLQCLIIKKERGAPYVKEATPPDAALHPVMCNGVLEHLGVPTLNPGLVARLTGETRAAVAESRPSPVLPKLTYLQVDRVQGAELTLSEAISLVTLAPRVEHVYFNTLRTRQACEGLEEFCTEYRGRRRVLISNC